MGVPDARAGHRAVIRLRGVWCGWCGRVAPRGRAFHRSPSSTETAAFVLQWGKAGHHESGWLGEGGGAP